MNRKFKRIIICLIFAILLSLSIFCCVGCENKPEEQPEESPVETFRISYIADEHGTIIGETLQTVKKGEDGTPVTAIADDGWMFVTWSDGLTTATRQAKDCQSAITYFARFERAYSVTYKSTEMGYIDGDAEQYILSRYMSKEVTAVPNEGYEFYCWSDGLKTATRNDGCFGSDGNFRPNFEVTALFKIKEYNVRYILQEGGYFVEGEENHSIPHGCYTPPIVVAPLPYYKFLGWSDGVTTTYRQEKITADFEVTALFEPLEVPVDYGVYKGGRIEGKTSQSIVCGNDATAVTAIPDEGFEFLGWTDGVKTATRQDTNIKHNVNVKANFAPIGSTQYKVLMVYVTKLQAELRSNLKTGDKDTFRNITVDYTMSETEWRIYDRITIKVGECINDMFDGKVWFIFESYFTKDTVYKDSIEEGWENGYLTHGINPSWIAELEKSEILKNYDTVMTTFSMDDYDSLLFIEAGSASKKYGYVHTEVLIGGCVINGYDPATILDEEKHKDYWDMFNQLYLHEFTHTCELWDMYGDLEGIIKGLVDLHGTLSYYSYEYYYQGKPYNEIDILKLFLLGEAVVDGEETGVLLEYWSYDADRREYIVPRIPGWG